MRRPTFDEIASRRSYGPPMPVQPWLRLVDSQPIWYISTQQQILRRWQWLQWRFPRFVQVRPVGESAQGRPMYLGTVSREGDFSLEQLDGFLSLNGNHACEFGGALGSAFVATGMAFSLENGCDRWGYPYQSLLCTDPDGSAANTHLGKRLSWEVFMFGRYRPLGTTYCVDYEMRRPGVTRPNQRPEAKTVDDLLETLDPSSVMSNHGQVLGMGEYAEVTPNRGNLAFTRLVSAVIDPCGDVQPFSLDYPNTVPYAPGVFPAPAKGPGYDGSQGLTFSERMRLDEKGYRACLLLSEPRLFHADYLQAQESIMFDREQVCREGNDLIARLTHPFIERVGNLPLDLDNRVHEGALGRLGRHASVLDKTWDEMVPNRPMPRDVRAIQYERFALNERRFANAMLDLADSRRVALECGDRRLAKNITDAVDGAMNQLGRTVGITLRPLQQVIKSYVALELASMAGNLSMGLFDFGPEVQARYEQLRASELSGVGMRRDTLSRTLSHAAHTF